MALESARADWVRAELHRRSTRYDLALPLYERAIDAALRAEGPQSRLAIDVRRSFAGALMAVGELEASKRQFAAALAGMRALGGADDIGAALVEAGWTSSMYSMSTTEAKRMISFEEALATLSRIKNRFDEPSSRVPESIRARVDFALATVYLQGGVLEPARALLASSVPVRRSQTEAPSTHYFAANWLGVSAMDRGEHEEADRHLREALELGKVVEGNTSFMVFRYTLLARNLSMQGRFEEAEAVLASAPPVAPASGGEERDHVVFRGLAIARARVKLDRGDPAAALALLPPDHGDIEDFTYEDRRLLRGAALCALGRWRDGLPLMETHTQKLAEDSSALHSGLARWRATTGLCALDAGDHRRAVELAELARQALTQQPGVSPVLQGAAARAGETAGAQIAVPIIATPSAAPPTASRCCCRQQTDSALALAAFEFQQRPAAGQGIGNQGTQLPRARAGGRASRRARTGPDPQTRTGSPGSGAPARDR
jgi:tetratricopeptide (TPR) repeat protein